ncbi:MAG: GDP-L-fucose synthase [Desulfosarcina sp.]|nr:GDP-L-fucose synthase [Desulfosarcina sp.]MBC2744266.1 GDP-L-fucose synthase [Desulfosarcina sp.]MBC2767175.1 GDP-L-fucose synthase [Desulfosarcina sp.]
MRKDACIFVAGAAGMAGSAIIRKLLSMGYTNLVGSYHSHMPDAATFMNDGAEAGVPKGLKLVQVDLTVQSSVNRFFAEEKPAYVFLAAAKVGGINANSSYPAQFIYDNLVIQGSIIHAAYQTGVDRLLFLGSSCIYPKLAPQPMKEEHLLTGLLEPTNEPYAIAKIAGIKMCESYNRQYGTRFMAVMPTNLYGTNDNFDLEDSHVLPALMRKFHEAKAAGKHEVTVWGTGVPRREFLHVDDMADACVYVMNLDEKAASDELLSYPKPCFVNVGTGVDCTIRELAEIVRDAVGFNGEIVFDVSKPDGTPQKRLDVLRLAGLGWRSSISLTEGIRQTYQWYLNRVH